MKTIKDIVAEMRKDMPRVVDTKVILRNYADRIEAAREFELAVENAKATGEGYAAGKQSVIESRCTYGEVKEPTCEKSSAVGNAAKMREALEWFWSKRSMLDFCHNNLSTKTWEDWDKVYRFLREFAYKVQAALSTPARNCDVGTAEEQASDED